MTASLHGATRGWIFALGVAVLVHAAVAMIPLSLGGPVAEPGIAPVVHLQISAHARRVATPGAAPAPSSARTPVASDPVQSNTGAPRAHRNALPLRPRSVQRDAAHADVMARVQPGPASLLPDTAQAGAGLMPGTLDVAGRVAAPALDRLPGELAQPGPQRDPAMDRDAYASQVRALIEAHKRYPARARRQRREGEVIVTVSIAAEGHLASAPRVATSSGTRALDHEALRMVQRANPFPPSGAATTLDIPVRFSLNDL